MIKKKNYLNQPKDLQIRRQLRPSMAWTAKPIKHFVEMKHESVDKKRPYIHSQEYEHKEHSSDISVLLFDKDEQVIVTPYTLECLTLNIDEEYNVGTMKELIVGIRNESLIEYFGIRWLSKQTDSVRINQYFFKDDKPKSFYFGHVSGPGWPTNQGPILDEVLERHLRTLEHERPKVKESLKNCIIQLYTPGPDHTGEPDAGIKIKLR